MNKVMAGYHMLMILSQIDGDFDRSEGKVIVKYLKDAFPFRVNLDGEMAILSALPSEDYFLHFNNAMNDFYEDSDEQERVDFLKFAVKMVKADKKITPEENKYLKELFFAWDSEHE
ncbi:MAG TPA: TerB family tellurite resistance protein [Bacteroidia bacterium]